MVLLNDLIRIHEEALEPEICDQLIELYELNSDKHERIDNQKRPSFTQFNLTKNSNLNIDVHTHIINKVFDYTRKYYDFIDARVFPPSNAFEEFRIKKYETGGNDMYDTHVDVQDHASARRFLSFMWYLNDVDDGGKTVFNELEIKPQKGKLIIFPPMWMYPHKGEPPVSCPKYILSTYLHYK